MPVFDHPITFGCDARIFVYDLASYYYIPMNYIVYSRTSFTYEKVCILYVCWRECGSGRIMCISYTFYCCFCRRSRKVCTLVYTYIDIILLTLVWVNIDVRCMRTHGRYITYIQDIFIKVWIKHRCVLKIIINIRTFVYIKQ